MTTTFNRNEKFSPFLFDYIKKKINLSEYLSVEIGCHLNWYEPGLTAGCICPMPNHKDGKPSFRIKYLEKEGFWVFNCLAGDTKVMTWNGSYPIRDLVGTTQKVLTERGKWVDAPFDSYGLQKVSQVTLSRNGQKKIVKCTPDHRWFIRRKRKKSKSNKDGKISAKVEKLTKDLKIGDALSWVFPRNKVKQIASLSPQGIQHGVVFGDGSITSKGTMAVVDLWGKKDAQLLKWFPQNRSRPVVRSDKLKGIHVLELPLFFKDRPSPNESPAYLSGFLAGWLAADGCVAKDGTLVLNSSVKENLEFAKLVAMRLGIGTYGITSRLRMGINNKMSEIYSIHFITEDLDERFFLINEHRSRFIAAKKKWFRRAWVVKSIQEDAGTEEVFCATVDKTHSFALEGNILTGNCLGCGAHGTILEFCRDYYNLRNKAEAVLFLCDKYGYKKTDQIVMDGLKDVKKTINLQKKIDCAHVVASRQCFYLLKKDYKMYNNWVKDAYNKMNKALDDDDIDAIESIGFEASNKMTGG